MENKKGENISQIYLQPKKNPQIRIGTKFQAAIPNDKASPCNIEIPQSSHQEDFVEKSHVEGAKTFTYNEHFLYSNKNIIENPEEINENDFVKPGKKRRIEK